MGIKELLVCLSIVLFASTIILAEESTENANNSSNSSAVSNNSSHPGSPKSPGSGPHLSRPRRSPEHQGKAASRRACGSGGRGSRCRSCHEVIECRPGSNAVVRKCSGSQRYCNRGRCSSTPGGKCRRSSTSSTSTSTGTTTTGSSDSDSTTSSTTSTSSSDDSTSSTDSSTSSTSSSSSSSTTTTTEASDYE